MKLIKVKSSNISMVGLKEEKLSLNSPTKNILRVVFVNERTYDYFDVPKEVFEDFLSSESKGKFFNKNIQNNYEFERIE